VVVNVNLTSGVKMANLYLMGLTFLVCVVTYFMSTKLASVQKGCILVELVEAMRLKLVMK